MPGAIRRTFASLAVRNYRLYFIGQGVSLCGNWIRMVALPWLVLQQTHSGTQLGLVTAAQFLPMLLFGAFGGLIVDRRDNKRLLIFTQAALGLVSLAIGLLVVTHSIELWMIYGLSVIAGMLNVVDVPARQTFVVQLVGEDKLRNAVSLNSMIVNTARIVGPAIAATLIAVTSVGVCFLLDAATFLAVLIVLGLMRRQELHKVDVAPTEPGQLKAGFRYVLATPVLRTTLLMMLIIGTFAYEFPVVLPLFATTTLHGNATTYALMTAAMGIGALAGGLYSAASGELKMRRLIKVAACFGLSILLLAVMPGLISCLFVLLLVGALSVLFISLGNTTLQLTAVPQMRGRVMALWAIAFQGTTPIGGPIIGAIADRTSPRVGLAVGGVSAIIAAGIGLFVSGYKLPSARNKAKFFEGPEE